MKPLPRTHPELEILQDHPEFVEFRVYNYSLAKDGSNTIRRRYGYSIWDVVVLLGVYSSWRYFESRWLVACLLAIFLRAKLTQLLWESVVVLPHIGIQIQSTRGFTIPFTGHMHALSTSRHFITCDTIHDIIINEGLHRWDWYYYLAILRRNLPRSPNGPDPPYEVSMVLSFENILPPLDVVREVYHGVREILFDEYEEKDESLAHNQKDQ